MREYVLEITSKDLASGMLPRAMPFNSNFSEELVNVECYPESVQPYQALINPVQGVSPDFPFPQLFVGKTLALLASRDAIYSVDLNTWRASQLTTMNREGNSAADILEGSSWHFADFHKAWMLFNGRCIVLKHNMPSVMGYPSWNPVVISDTHAETGCEFRGRAVMGGFEPVNFWNSEWEVIWTAWKSKFPSNFGPADFVGRNFVFWSSIGGGDAFLPFYADLARHGVMGSTIGYGQNKPMWDTYLKRNEWGFMPMPWAGKVLKLKSLGENLIVYGENGISVLRPFAEPTPTLGLVSTFGVGIPHRSCIGGDEFSHLFIDHAGACWKLDGSLKPSRLGYESYFSPLLDTELIISYDSGKGNFYIANEDEGFMLSPVGLSRVYQKVHSCCYVEGGSIGTMSDTGEYEFYYRSDLLNFNLAGLKKIEAIELNLSTEAPVYVAVQFRYKTSEAWRESDWVRANNEGIAYLGIQATQFKLLVKGMPFNKIKLSGILVHWKLTDKRAVRGEYVSRATA